MTPNPPTLQTLSIFWRVCEGVTTSCDKHYCCADCGNDGGKNHWPKHKKDCKERAAELRDKAMFKDTPAKEECPICFIPMPIELICCVSLPPATISSVPIFDFAIANNGVEDETTEKYYPCCGKRVYEGCIHSFDQSGNDEKCPFCNSDRDKTEEEKVEQITKRVAANDAVAMGMLAAHYNQGLGGVQQDHIKAIELFTKSAELGCSKAHSSLGNIYYEGGYLKKTKFHFEAAAMAGNERARNNLGNLETEFGNTERAIKHWMIAASAGDYFAMHELITLFKKGFISSESIDTTLAAYNSSCAEMRSEARDSRIRAIAEII